MFPSRSPLCTSQKPQMTTHMTLRSHARNALKAPSHSRYSISFTPDRAFLLLENLRASFQFNQRGQQSTINANKALSFVCKYELASSNSNLNATAFTCNKLFAAFNQRIAVCSDLSPHLYQSVTRGIDKIQKKIHEEKKIIDNCLKHVQGKGLLNTRQLGHFYRTAISSGITVPVILMQLEGLDLGNLKQSIKEANQSKLAIKKLAIAIDSFEVYKSTMKLINAVKNLQLSKIHEILENETVDFELNDPYGKSLVLYICATNCKETATAILSSDQLSASVLSKKSAIEWTYLHEIAAIGSENATLCLLKSQKVSTEFLGLEDGQGRSLLYHLISRRSYKVIDALLSMDAVTPQLLSATDAYGDNYISNMIKSHMASEKQLSLAVKAILSSDKVSLDMLMHENNLGFSALQRIVDYGYEEANNAILDSDKVTIEALSHYNQYGDSPLARMTSKGSPITHEAIIKCSKVTGESLVARCTNLQSPLMMMALGGQLQVHQAILSSEKITRQHLICKGDNFGSNLNYIAEYGSAQIHIDILQSDKVKREDLIYSDEESFSILERIVDSDSFISHIAVLSSEKIQSGDLTTSIASEITPLNLMISRGNDVTHDAILASDKVPASVLTEKDEAGVFPLLLMASSFFLETQQAILRCDKVTPEALLLKDSHGDFPLIHMISTQEESLYAEILSSEKVSKKALQLENSKGQTPLSEMASIGGTETYFAILGSDKVDHDMLIDHTRRRSSIMSHLAKSKRFDVHQAILDSDKVSAESLNVEDAILWTPLKLISLGGSINTIQALLASNKVTTELLNDQGSLNLSCIQVMSAKKCVQTCYALLDSDKVTKATLSQKGLIGNTPLIHMSLLRNSELHQAILDSDKVDSAALCTRNEKGFTALMGIVGQSPQESLQAVLKSEKVTSEILLEKFTQDDMCLGCQIAQAASKETIELLIERHSSVIANILSELGSDITTQFKIKHVQSPSSLDKIKRSLSLSSRENSTNLFKALISFSQRARFLAAMEHENLLCSTLTFSPLITLASGSFDTLPTPESIDSIDIGDLKSIAVEVFPESTFTPLDEMIARVKSREPYYGLPSFETSPAAFEKAYAHIEKGLKVFVLVAGELSSKYKSATSDEAKKDLKDRLESFYSRLSFIAQRCGTRYTQDIPMLYQELALEDDIECIQNWKSQAVAIPSSSDPRHAIKEHLTPTLSKLKMQALKEIYTRLTTSSNSHSISAFWKAIADDFKLEEDIDPTTEALRLSIDTVKKDFVEIVDEMGLIEKVKPMITPNGDSNPYSTLIGALAHQCEYDSVEAQMKAFNTDEATYESGDMTDGFTALCLIEAGLASI